jgi:acyl dehydratase
MARGLKNLGRRQFLTVSSVAVASSLIMKAFGLAFTRVAAAASSASAAYNRAIDKMVEETRKKMAAAAGWGKGRGSATVTAQGLINHASSTITYNPFWIDEAYAAGTRWGGLTALPMYSSGASQVSTAGLETPDCGFDRQLWPGQDWDFFQPIRVGDTLRGWNRTPTITEQKSPDRGGVRGFFLVEGDCDGVNQRGEIVSTMRNYTVRIFFPDGPPGTTFTLNRYGFSKEEIVYLDRLARQTKVRGANIRRWEDVKVGDMLDPTVIAPTNIQDIASQGGGAAAAVGGAGGAGGIGSGGGRMGGAPGGEAPAEQKPVHQLLQKEGVISGAQEYIQDPATGYYYKGGGDTLRHWDDIASHLEGEPGAFLWGVMSQKSMLRCITNWMGDDAFIRKFNWRHIYRTLVGEASYSLGKVTNKRNENGEYLVDLFVWQQDIRGYIVDAAVCTVALLSKTKPYPDLKKVITY